jgi:hypothetical protein
MKKALTVVPNKPPAVEREWPTQQQVRRVADKLDRLADYSETLCEVNAKLRDAGHMSEAWLGSAEFLIGQHPDLSVKIKALLSETNALDPDHWMDDDGNVQCSSVSVVLANLMGSFPTSNIPNPKVFTRLLLEDVMDLKPFFPELESACRKLRTSMKFMPSISEVVEAIKAEQKAWSRRYDAVSWTEGTHTEATKLLAAALEERGAERQRREVEQQKREAEQKRRDEIRAARALPICIGDRVRSRYSGLGTVTGVWGAEFCVDFDKDDNITVDPACLERLAACEESEGGADA